LAAAFRRLIIGGGGAALHFYRRRDLVVGDGGVGGVRTLKQSYTVKFIGLWVLMLGSANLGSLDFFSKN